MKVEIKDIKDQKQRNTIQFFLDGLKHWYNEMCIYNGDSIMTFNRKHKLWGLKNSIILDASSTIDGVYHISEDFNVIGDERIIDHNNSTFYRIPFNTSKSNLNEKQNEYFKELAEKIEENHQKGEQTLIICHEDNSTKIENQLLRLGIKDIHIANETLREEDEELAEGSVAQAFAINWSGNVIGKNAYADFTNCWIVGTPNIPIGQYLIHYMMYTKQSNLANKKIEIAVGRFKNDDFNKVQRGFVAADIYQSLKRIQSNVKPSGKFFIINSNQAIIDLVLGQIKGTTNRKEIQLKFIQEHKNQIGSNNVDLFIDYLKNNVSLGEHSKGDICEALGISRLYRVLKADRVNALVIHGFIKVDRTKIVKLKSW